MSVATQPEITLSWRTQVTVPLDPDSDQARALVDRLGDTLARLRVNVAARKAATGNAAKAPATPALSTLRRVLPVETEVAA